MKNTILKVVAVVALILSFAFSWVNTPAYAFSLPDEAVQGITGDAKTVVNFSTLENRIEKLEARTQVLENRNADTDAKTA